MVPENCCDLLPKQPKSNWLEMWIIILSELMLWCHCLFLSTFMPFTPHPHKILYVSLARKIYMYCWFNNENYGYQLFLFLFVYLFCLVFCFILFCLLLLLLFTLWGQVEWFINYCCCSFDLLTLANHYTTGCLTDGQRSEVYVTLRLLDRHSFASVMFGFIVLLSKRCVIHKMTDARLHQ